MNAQRKHAAYDEAERTLCGRDVDKVTVVDIEQADCVVCETAFNANFGWGDE